MEDRIRVPKTRGLAPLVGAGMAAVAAGSLVLFSFMAERVAIIPPRGRSVAPKEPVESAPGPIVVPAPSPTATESTPGGVPEVIAIGPATPAELDQESAIVSTTVAVKVAFRPPVRARGPWVGIKPNTPRPPDYEGPTQDCPGRPTTPRAPGGHPHGGPPACGNPHGDPPGYAAAKNQSSTDSDDSRAERGPKSQGRHHTGTAGGAKKDGGDASSSSPSKHRSPSGSGDRPAPSDGSGPSHHSGSPPGHSGSDHPQGGPPGHSKSSSGSGHPHGGPPGHSKAKKKS